ncbi:universal stress protein [Microbacterium sp. SLBN-146]|uniref:universal stress protein n=1 Tax=Microbacterium sp. SLBN-146 TaxID=2768457 RepID=UPI00114FE2B0|nr:universal stress protein [Microbacterium sp. SLBN-146]TQJ31319.1 nucleotide-binding universal stress UspA family protein [Microbacterium sp. SLBN-146]
MERILIGFDGSPASVSALTWVAERASRGPATVSLTSVVSRGTAEHSEAMRVLTDADAFLRERAPGTTVRVMSPAGGVVDVLLRSREQADLVVVGVDPGHPLRSALAGPLPLRISTRSRVPVVMVPPGWVDVGDPVTVGIDSDDSSDDAVSFGADEAFQSDRSLRLVHAWLMPTPTFTGATARMASPEAVVEGHRMTLDAATRAASLRHPALDVCAELHREGASTALLRYAPESSMLVIGTHRRGVVAGSLWGSVAHDVLWRAECPIVVVPSASRER